MLAAWQNAPAEFPPDPQVAAGKCSNSRARSSHFFLRPKPCGWRFTAGAKQRLSCGRGSATRPRRQLPKRHWRAHR